MGTIASPAPAGETVSVRASVPPPVRRPPVPLEAPDCPHSPGPCDDCPAPAPAPTLGLDAEPSTAALMASADATIARVDRFLEADAAFARESARRDRKRRRALRSIRRARQVANVL